MTIKKIATTAAILAAGSGTAFAGGLDRVTFSSDILYEEGNYAEVAFGLTSPKVNASSAPVSVAGSVAESFNTVKLGFKTDITKKIAVALTYTNQPVGADINYGPLLGGVAGAVNGQRLTLLGKYQFTDRVSAFGGVKYQYINGGVNVPGVNIVSAGEDEFGYIVGAAYEIPAIELRVALSYESEDTFELESTVNGAPAGVATAGTPEAWNLEFQSGVAKNTLVFGSIRYAKWEDVQITVPVLGTITSNENTTSYELGVAHRFNDTFTGFAAIGYEAPDDETQGTFAPTDGQFDFTFGSQISFGQGYKVTSGITYSRRGDAILSPTSPFAGATFNDNSVLTVGVKLSKNF